MSIRDGLVEPHIWVLKGLSECTMEYSVIDIDANHNLVSHLDGCLDFFHQVLDKLFPDIGGNPLGLVEVVGLLRCY
jgi:hypothetical protein